MELPVHEPLAGAATRHAPTPPQTTQFTGDDLLAALEAYEELPIDLVLDASGDVEFSSLASPTTSDSSDAQCRSAVSLLNAAPITPQVPRSQRMKAERAFLQDQITQLERELASAKDTHRSPHGPSAWRDVAKRQRARRSAVEQENERLRAKLIRQIQIAKSLQVVLLRRSTKEEKGPTQPPADHDEETAWMDDLGHVLRHFVANIARAYKAVDVVLPATGSDVPTMDAPVNRSVVKAHTVDGVEQLYVETRQAYVVPFAFDHVVRVAWRAFTSHFARQNRQLELYCCTDDLFACKFAGRPRSDQPSPSRKEDADCTATVVARSYLQPGERSVVVSRAFIASQDATYRDALAVSTVWIAFQPLASNADYTVADVCIRTVPRRGTVASLAHQRLVRLPTESVEMNAFTSQTLCTTSEDMIALIEEIENMVLDESIT